MNRLYALILAAIFLFCPGLRALKINRTCGVANCPRNMEPLGNVEDFYNHVLRICHSCPWCHDWIKFDSFNALILHIKLSHQFVDQIQVPFNREPGSKKRRNNGIISTVYTCERCQFVSVRSDCSFKHKCNGQDSWKNVRGCVKKIKYFIEKDLSDEESEEEVGHEGGEPPQAQTYFLRSRNSMQADNVNVNKFTPVDDLLQNPFTPIFRDDFREEIKDTGDIVSDEDELGIFMNRFFCLCCQMRYDSEYLFESHECVRYLGDWFS